MFSEKELKLLLWVLEESERCDDGSGHWLPDTFSKETQQAIKIVARELKNWSSRPLRRGSGL